MKRRIILNSKIIFTDPYVVHLTTGDHLSFYQVLQHSKKIFTGANWGYSENSFLNIAIIGGKGIYTQQSYWAFQDHQDALQFILTYGEHASRVYMWPEKNTFTIFLYE